MLKKFSFAVTFVSVFAIISVFAMIGAKDVKADAYADLVKRIEALEGRQAGNVTTSARGLKIGFDIRHRFEMWDDRLIGGNGLRAGSHQASGVNQGRRVIPIQNAAIPNSPGERGLREDYEFVLQRVRLSFDADVNKNVRGFIKLQDSRHFGAEGGAPGQGSDTIGNLARTDVLEAYAELRNLSGMLSCTEFRVGRWQMFYGNHRLIGHLNWANEGRAYDGARVRWNNKKNAWVDVFATIIDEKGTTANGGVGGAAGEEDGTAFGGIDEVLYGVYSQFKVYPGNKFEPYVLIRARSAENTQPSAAFGDLGEHRYTVGFRLDGRKVPGLGGLDYTIEPAWQFGTVEGMRAGDYSERNVVAGTANGSTESNAIQAFAIYAGTGYTFNNVWGKPRIGYAYVFASGDDRPNSGSAKTFDHLYPTGHAQLGYMDYAAWQNIEDHQIHFSIKPTKKLIIDIKGHFFDLDEEADRWYNVAGGTGFGGGLGTIRQGADLYTDANGSLRNVDDDLGEEIDVTVKYKMFKNFGVVAGYSHFFAGDFVDDTASGPNSSDDDTNWWYLQTTLKF